MKQKLLVFGFLICSLFANAQLGYQITVKYMPYTDGKLFLGYHFGKNKLVLDSAIINAKGEAVFIGKEKLPGGIYLIVNPSKTSFFEILMDSTNQIFSVFADSADIIGSFKVKGSLDNELFNHYQKRSAQYYNQIKPLQDEFLKAKNKSDSTTLTEQYKLLSKAFNKYRDSIEKIHPDGILSALFRALKEPELPENLLNAKTRNDTLAQAYYIKKHFWDGVSFYDDRLLRTPFFEEKLEKYFKNFVYPVPDSIIKEVDWMILYSRANKNMFKYFVTKFTNDYIEPKIMGQDAVFVFLFEKYYLTKQVDWLSEKNLGEITNYGYRLLANQLGANAAELNLLDTLDKPVSLYNTKSPYTIICFWDPNCGHCKETVPKVDSIYHAKWKNLGITLIGVLIDTIRAENKQGWAKLPEVKNAWKSFIHEHKLKGWLHWYQSPEMKESDMLLQRPSFRQLYNIYSTPKLFLLDKDKRIIAKEITYLQIDEVLDVKIKQSANK